MRAVPINVLCSHCESRFNLQDDLLGKKMLCPVCREIFIVEVAPVAVTTPAATESAPPTDKPATSRTDAPAPKYQSGSITPIFSMWLKSKPPPLLPRRRTAPNRRRTRDPLTVTTTSTPISKWSRKNRRLRKARAQLSSRKRLALRRSSSNLSPSRRRFSGPRTWNCRPTGRSKPRRTKTNSKRMPTTTNRRLSTGRMNARASTTATTSLLTATWNRK